MDGVVDFVNFDGEEWRLIANFEASFLSAR